MTNAGISIHDSIKEVANSTEDKRLKFIFQTIDEELNQGSSLTNSIENFKRRAWRRDASDDKTRGKHW